MRALLVTSVLLACNPEDGRASASATLGTMSSAPTGVGGTEAATTGATTGGATVEVPTSTSMNATGEDSTAASGTTGALKFDMPTPDFGGATTGAMGCDKVDFLFVIDNSASMEDSQAALIQSFPGFIAAIEAALVDTKDYQIMVVDSDGDGRCAQPCDMTDPEVVEFCAEADYHACEAQLEVW